MCRRFSWRAFPLKPSKTSGLVRYAIRDVALLAKEEEKKGRKIIYLNIGDPCEYDFSPPRAITDAVKEALEGSYKAYAPSAGDPELRREIAKIEGCNPEEVFVTAGLSEGVDFTMRIMLDSGDSVLLPNPTYPLYNEKANVIGALPGFYESTEEWLPDTDDLRKRIGKRTKAVVVINPNNPTGAVYPRRVLREIADISAEHDLAIFADEVYDHLIFGRGTKMHKMKDVAPKDVTVFSGNSLSKNFLYPGSRIGYIAVHNDNGRGFTDAFMRMCNQRLSVNWEFQRGAIAAYRGGFGFLPPNLEKLKRRSRLLCRRIDEIPGLSAHPPSAALYGFVKVEGYRPKGKRYHKSMDWNFVYDLLRTEGVLVVPGSAFYKNHPRELYFRTTFLPGEGTINEAMDKLGRFMKARRA